MNVISPVTMPELPEDTVDKGRSKDISGGRKNSGSKNESGQEVVI